MLEYAINDRTMLETATSETTATKKETMYK